MTENFVFRIIVGKCGFCLRESSKDLYQNIVEKLRGRKVRLVIILSQNERKITLDCHQTHEPGEHALRTFSGIEC